LLGAETSTSHNSSECGSPTDTKRVRIITGKFFSQLPIFQPIFQPISTVCKSCKTSNGPSAYNLADDTSSAGLAICKATTGFTHETNTSTFPTTAQVIGISISIAGDSYLGVTRVSTKHPVTKWHYSQNIITTDFATPTSFTTATTTLIISSRCNTNKWATIV
jgi:hypothetical protein